MTCTDFPILRWLSNLSFLFLERLSETSPWVSLLSLFWTSRESLVTVGVPMMPDLAFFRTPVLQAGPGRGVPGPGGDLNKLEFLNILERSSMLVKEEEEG